MNETHDTNTAVNDPENHCVICFMSLSYFNKLTLTLVCLSKLIHLKADGQTSESSRYCYLKTTFYSEGKQVSAAPVLKSWTMNGCAVSGRVIMHAACVFRGQVRSVLLSPPHPCVIGHSERQVVTKKPVTLQVLLMPKHSISEYLMTIKSRMVSFLFSSHPSAKLSFTCFVVNISNKHNAKFL